MNLELVRLRADVVRSLNAFNRDAKRDEGTVRALLRQTSFWVYDAETNRFAPSKFAGFKGMTVPDYAIAKANGRLNRGATFNGHLTRLAISKALGDRAYRQDSRLNAALVHWAEDLLRAPDVLKKISRTKWRFVML